MRTLTPRERMLAAAAVVALALAALDAWRQMRHQADQLEAAEHSLAAVRQKLADHGGRWSTTGEPDVAWQELLQVAGAAGMNRVPESDRTVFSFQGSGTEVWRVVSLLSSARGAAVQTLSLTRVGRELEVVVTMERPHAP